MNQEGYWTHRSVDGGCLQECGWVMRESSLCAMNKETALAY